MIVRNNPLTGRALGVCLTSAVLLFGSGVPPAAAQQVQGGGAIVLLSSFIRGVDTTFDPSTNGYFVVGGQGTIVGMCVNSGGHPTSGLITINPSGFGAFPRARFSPHLGGFLVVWSEEAGNPSELHARTVTCSGQMGAEQVISGGHNAWLESGPAIAYSPSSQRFLVAWKSFAPAFVKIVLVDNNGSQASGVVDVSSGFARDPGATWNSHTDQFGVSFSGESGDPNSPTNYNGFVVVPASNPGGFSRTTFNAFGGGMNTITDVDFVEATGRYVMSWFELSSGLYAKIAEFDAGGNLIGTGIASTRLGSYDALSVAYNPVTATSLLAGLDRANDAVLGLELNVRGYPFNGENTINSNFIARYPRVASSRVDRTWNVDYSGGPAGQFGGISNFMATSFASSGGPGGDFGGGSVPAPPPPAPTPPPPTGCTTASPGPGWECVNGGWVPPPTTSPGGCTTVQPDPTWTCVNGGWLPPGAGGTPTSPTGGCTTISPGADWTCVNGGWLPPGAGGGGGSACPTIQPDPSWICVNGGWLPPGAGGTPTSPTGGCTTMQPGADWTCVNGGWLPLGAVGTTTSGCPTIQPGSSATGPSS